jgi:hypothetical protein
MIAESRSIIRTPKDHFPARLRAEKLAAHFIHRSQSPSITLTIMTTKTVSVILVLAFLTGCQISQTPTPTAAPAQWESYTNHRFGFRLTYPASLIGGRDPQNGAGKSFASANGDFEVHVEGHFITDGQTLHDYYLEHLAVRKGTITYTKKGPSWYVISGTNKKGYEYYVKFFVKDENWVELHMVYPHSKANVYDTWVETIEDSFIPFLEGDYDRPIGD